MPLQTVTPAPTTGRSMLKYLSQTWTPSGTSFIGIRGALGLVAAATLITAAVVKSDDTIPKPITASTVCKDFTPREPMKRASATIRLATELGVPNPRDMQRVPTLEARCIAEPDLTLGDFFRELK